MPSAFGGRVSPTLLAPVVAGGARDLILFLWLGGGVPSKATSVSSPGEREIIYVCHM
jgi:hypothetical protein